MGFEDVLEVLDVAAASVLAVAAVVDVAAPGPGNFGRFAGVFCAATWETSRMDVSRTGKEKA